ncbi:MAG: HEAT repeat domain-containing protein [Gemmatimonadota bacterium]|nr:HEAT repeat domain-containing protein [Gemmatimonadota bacterium]
MKPVPAAPPRIALALSLVLLPAACALAEKADPAPAPPVDTPLAERWARAVEALAERTGSGTTWIGWSIDRSKQALVMSDTGPPFLEGPEGRSLAEMLGEKPEGTRVAFLFAFPPGANGEEAIAATRLRSLYAPVDVSRSSLVWLGRTGDAESVALLESIFSRIRSPEVRTELGPMIAVHEESGVAIPALRRVVAGDEPDAVRAEAVAWIDYQRDDPRARELLLEVLREKPSYRVLDEAIGSIDLERGVKASTIAALLALLAEHPDPEARALVAELLGETGDPGALAALEAAAATDPASRVRREALDALEDAREP